MLRCAALVYKLMLSKHIHSLLSKQQSGSLCTYSTAELIIAATPHSPSQYLSTFLFLLRPFFLSLSLLSPALCSATRVNHIVHLLSSVPERVGLSARALQSFHTFAFSLNNYRMWVVVSFSHFDSFIMTQWEVNKLIPQMMDPERQRERETDRRHVRSPALSFIAL